MRLEKELMRRSTYKLPFASLCFPSLSFKKGMCCAVVWKVLLLAPTKAHQQSTAIFWGDGGGAGVSPLPIYNHFNLKYVWNRMLLHIKCLVAILLNDLYDIEHYVDIEIWKLKTYCIIASKEGMTTAYFCHFMSFIVLLIKPQCIKQTVENFLYCKNGEGRFSNA